MAGLGGFSEEALQLFQLAASEQGYDFSEGGETYDFTRCMRPDGSFYGTSGTCKKGSVAGAKEKAAPKTEGGMKRRATAEGKAAAKAASRKAAGEKISAGAARTRRFKDELEKVRDKMKGASPEEQNRLIAEASKRADRAPQASALKRKAAKTQGTADDAARAMREAEKQLDAARNSGDYGKVGKLQTKIGKLRRRMQDADERASNMRKADEAKKAASQKPKTTATPGMAAKAKAAREKLGSDKAPAAEAKPKRKLASTAETKPKWQEAERAVVDAKKKWQDANRETKGDQSVEARQRRLQAGRELDKAERAAEKASNKYFAAAKRESRAAMTPEQRKEEREWNKFKKTYG